MSTNNLFRAMVIAIALFLVFTPAAEAATLGDRVLRMGVQGEDVAELQDFLNRHGYRDGRVDGVFGPLTFGSLLEFQSDSGLKADGIAGSETLDAINEIRAGESEEGSEAMSTMAEVENEFNFTPAEMDLFARIVHAEAEGESHEGQVAVAASILNRIRSNLYPNTMAGVVYQVVMGRYQYSPVLDGRINRPAGESAKKAIQDALNGWDPSGGATGFYNPAKTANQWVRSRPVTRAVGSHVFFK